ncbi:MAG TPA: hypothetical protein VI759_06550 [Dehalococcoidia bacterium]|nr:hypothetical protein [Dehalococcoidia bacterium]
MKLPIIGLVITVLALGAGAFALTTATPTQAQEAPQDELALAGAGCDCPWLKESIIAAAAQTIGIRPEEVIEGLRHGASLKQIAARNGVREPALKRGILAHEKTYLYRLVDAGKLERPEAVRILKFLTDHIDRIVNWHS